MSANIIPINVKAPPSPMDAVLAGQPNRALTRADIVAAVRNEVGEILSIPEADLAWIVEATLVQLGHGLRQCGAADLGYAGTISGPYQGQDFYIYRPFEGGTDDAA